MKFWANIILLFPTCYFRYTDRLIRGCSHFVSRCNIIGMLWETKKEQRLSYRKSYIEEFVWRVSLFWLHALLSMKFFVTFFVYSVPFLKWHTCWMDPIKMHNVAMGGILCDDITISECLEIWKSLVI